MLFNLLPVSPDLPILAAHILAAVLPSVYLLRYIYRHDTVEPEPPGLLFKLLIFGVLAALCCGFLERIGDALLMKLIPLDSRAYTILFAFLVVAAVEEGTKFIFLKFGTWRDKEFNYLFDGVVYSAFVSLGFAAFENIHYVFNYGLSVALARALLAIPGHLSFSIFMGVYYGRARLYANRGNRAASKINLLFGYLFATVLHGFYDTCAMLSTMFSTILFLIFIILMFTAAFRTLKRESNRDAPIISRYK